MVPGEKVKPLLAERARECVGSRMGLVAVLVGQRRGKKDMRQEARSD